MHQQEHDASLLWFDVPRWAIVLWCGGEETLEVRTKPTMCKKTLRSVLAVAFSAGLASGVLGAIDLAAGAAPERAAELRSEAAPPPDLTWDFVPSDWGSA
ncbi:hypothetical protein [Streptomyces sp. SID14515]|uniref:hypothetical protein n=1 Tax=Streptomyces sp. SID14515 TaxID=2706074 RepID=UPI0013C77B40|nr:hypothetical protein [Streptomyces sp. SID14515]NEB37971.1 hypothetical protein [Streptomyces sp. SID14515]